MRAGLLNKIIRFQEPDFGEDFSPNEYHDVFQTRARVLYEGSNIVNEIGDIFYTLTVTFTIRNHSKITDRMRILFEGNPYRIISTPYVDEVQLSIVIKAEKINE